eukprot:13121316-Alexandrium_andersonii.AAC.1
MAAMLRQNTPFKKSPFTGAPGGVGTPGNPFQPGDGWVAKAGGKKASLASLAKKVCPGMVKFFQGGMVPREALGPWRS